MLAGKVCLNLCQRIYSNLLLLWYPHLEEQKKWFTISCEGNLCTPIIVLEIPVNLGRREISLRHVTSEIISTLCVLCTLMPWLTARGSEVKGRSRANLCCDSWSQGRSLWKIWGKRAELAYKSWAIFVRKSEVEKKHQSRPFLTQLLKQDQICHWCILRKFFMNSSQNKVALSMNTCIANWPQAGRSAAWTTSSEYAIQLICMVVVWKKKKKINENSLSLTMIQIARNSTMCPCLCKQPAAQPMLTIHLGHTTSNN